MFLFISTDWSKSNSVQESSSAALRALDADISHVSEAKAIFV